MWIYSYIPSRLEIDRQSAPTLLSGGYWPQLYRRACEVDPSLLDKYTHGDSLSPTPSTELPDVAPSSPMKLSVTEHEHQIVCATPSASGTLPHMTFLSPVTTSESRATTPVSRAVTPTSLLYPVTPSISGATAPVSRTLTPTSLLYPVTPSISGATTPVCTPPPASILSPALHTPSTTLSDRARRHISRSATRYEKLSMTKFNVWGWLYQGVYQTP